VGYHSVVPDFRNFAGKDSISFIGLGIYDLKSNPYKINTKSIDFKSQTDKQGFTSSVFFTPYGQISTKVIYNDRMEQDGSTIGHTVEHAIKDKKDYKALGYIFENIEIEKNYSGFEIYRDFIGNDGACIAFCSLSASPVHYIMKELLPFEQFIYQYHDNPGMISGLAEKIQIFLDRAVSIATDSSAEIVFLGANYDSFLTWPEFFKEHITPYLKKSSELARKAGKFFLTHADGENEGLLPQYLEAGIDIADSICPYPMTHLKLADIRKSFKDKITIWGGIPSICVLEKSMNDYEFEKYLNGLLSDIGKGQRIILSFADTTPPGANFERIRKVAKLSREFKL
ncbi:MAG: hypothetical protein JW997_03925, partial [Actinobacteria bacterium]|nr:hypothetical protein [Actinomycetota bacterium]